MLVVALTSLIACSLSSPAPMLDTGVEAAAVATVDTGVDAVAATPVDTGVDAVAASRSAARRRGGQPGKAHPEGPLSTGSPTP